MQTWQYKTITASESRLSSLERQLDENGSQVGGHRHVGHQKGITSDQIGVLVKRPIE